MDKLLFRFDLLGFEMLETWLMDRVSLPGTPSPFFVQPPPPTPPPSKGRENTMGDSSFTKAGSLASQNMGTRSLLRNKYLTNVATKQPHLIGTNITYIRLLTTITVIKSHLYLKFV